MSHPQWSQRGYVLFDVLIASVVLGIAMGALLMGLAESRRQSAIAVHDQEASAFALARIEALRGKPIQDAAWAAGASASGVVPGHPSWTWQSSVAAVSDADVTGVPGPLSYRRAVVSVTYGGKTVRLETLRW